MGRMKLVLDLAGDLKRLAESIETLTKAMESGRLTEVEDGEVVTVQQVKEVLTEKLKAGKIDDVKELIKKYGGSKLTEVDPSNYGDLLKDAKAR